MNTSEFLNRLWDAFWKVQQEPEKPVYSMCAFVKELRSNRVFCSAIEEFAVMYRPMVLECIRELSDDRDTALFQYYELIVEDGDLLMKTFQTLLIRRLFRVEDAANVKYIKRAMSTMIPKLPEKEKKQPKGPEGPEKKSKQPEGPECPEKEKKQPEGPEKKRKQPEGPEKKKAPEKEPYYKSKGVLHYTLFNRDQDQARRLQEIVAMKPDGCEAWVRRAYTNEWVQCPNNKDFSKTSCNHCECLGKPSCMYCHSHNRVYATAQFRVGCGGIKFNRSVDLHYYCYWPKFDTPKCRRCMKKKTR